MSQLSPRVRQVYEESGRAVYRWVQDGADAMLESIPDDLRSSTTYATFQRFREETARQYYAARDLWNEGKYQEAANRMASLLRGIARAQDTIDSAARRTAAWRVALNLPGVREAVAHVRTTKRRMDELLSGLEGFGNAATGLLLAGAALVALLALR